ncbi:hypothetical protein [Xanthocytophaga agilis]|uniref:Uncharacterized protein n=1 Tax=Xanthocytophaga agilis TaxID=3048010 RepID=A0AAE3R2X4_9BACT|nr:hypothetical protein [Xanthocytophaga agilis]MDJ1500659.1 hypothetical protein [Xanthocytophaga agilis]
MDYQMIKELLDDIEKTGQVTEQQNQQVADILTQHIGIKHGPTSCKPCIKERITTLRDLIKSQPESE